MTAGGNQFSKVQTGQRRILRANVWNAMLDTVEYVAGLQESGGAMVGGAPANVCIRPVKNNSGVDLPRFGILGVDSVFFTPTDDFDGFQARPALQGVKPQLPNHLGKFCIAIEPIKASEIGLALFSGVCPVHVYQPGTIQLPFADIADQTTDNLRTGMHGVAQILWQENGQGTHWALVRLAPPQTIVRAVLSENLPECGAAKAQVIVSDAGGGKTEKDITITECWNRSLSPASMSVSCRRLGRRPRPPRPRSSAAICPDAAHGCWGNPLPPRDCGSFRQTGRIELTFHSVVQNAKVNGIEILGQSER